MEEKPTRYNLVEDSAEAILLNKINSDWEDEKIYSAYLENINLKIEELEKILLNINKRKQDILKKYL